MRRRRLTIFACFLVAASLVAGANAARDSQPRFRVVVVDRLSSREFASLAARGAVGLLVPSVGPTADRGDALADLVHGTALNTRLGAVPDGPPLFGLSRVPRLRAADDVIAVSLPPRQTAANDKRYQVAVIGRGFHGLLLSKTTRIPGLVSIVDIAPSVLGHANAALSSAPAVDPLRLLAQLDHRLHANNRLKFPALFIVAGVLLLLGLLRHRAAATAIPAALLVNAVLGVAGVANEVLICAALSAGTLAVASSLARVCRNDRSLLALYLGVLLLHALLFALRPEWLAITPLGPTQNQRFWGIGNQMETLLLAPMLTAAALAYRRFGAVGFALAALLAVVLMTDNRLGADGGGAIVIGVALAVLATRLCRLGAVGFVTTLLVAATVVLGVVWEGLQRPGPNHLRSAFTHGLGGVLAVVVDRVPLAYAPAVHQWTLVAPLAAVSGVALWVAFRVSQRRPERDLVVALAAGLATSLVVNDSAAYVLAAGIAATAAVGTPGGQWLFVPRSRAVWTVLLRQRVLSPVAARERAAVVSRNE